ncbi:MAG: RNA polymerase subunit sigma-70 [Planctomycetes bacterium]|nr:RNA polymerase subunit sigma-70 [Planctomycetota bacterium]
MDPNPPPRDDELLATLLAELRQKAQSLLLGERRAHTLQPTALVHEAWLRVREVADLPMGEDAGSRRRFVALAVRAMRNVLIDHARHRSADKRGGDRSRVELEDTIPVLTADPDTLLDLELALSRLANVSERLALVAELRLLGGLSMPEIAAVADLSLSTAKEDWSFAQALLARWLEPT